MGACFSSHTPTTDSDSESLTATATAKVVSLQGQLLEYSLPIFVSQVLAQLQDHSSQPPPCFLCNSDRLLYDQFIPALDMDDQLQPDQIYFLLPPSKLQYRLSASDMAALAVKASLALQNVSKKGGRKCRISPVLPVNQNQTPIKSFEKPFTPNPIAIGNGMSRSGSVRRLRRYTSGRAKLAVRSFRLRLSTIYEGIVL